MQLTRRVALRCFSCATTPLCAPVPPGSASYSDPKQFVRTPEDKRLVNKTAAESIVSVLLESLGRSYFYLFHSIIVYIMHSHYFQYKLGKHRSNALELVHQVPPIEVDGEMAICDGGGGLMGHPLEYISLARPGAVEYCKYCALRYTKKQK